MPYTIRQDRKLRDREETLYLAAGLMLNSWPSWCLNTDDCAKFKTRRQALSFKKKHGIKGYTYKIQ